MYDVAKPFKHKYWSDEVDLLEAVQYLHTGNHEGLPLLFRARGEVLQHGEEKALAVVHTLGSLYYQAGRRGNEGGEGGRRTRREGEEREEKRREWGDRDSIKRGSVFYISDPVQGKKHRLTVSRTSSR